ncbi:MAG: TIGR03960 family B12-binding radical SAM protein, partial [Oscillospiraceae bacterium]|nr:TIGR03960 family B12-binding radical SAM protein [Oscillospiraceae bacterium]
MHPELEAILPKVQKPARYTGGEYGEIIKSKDETELRFALCFPDTYEIGMSNLGLRILYGVLNRLPGVWCERVFEPWEDMAKAMREHGIPLYGLESGDPIRDFDLIGFSVGYEMSFTGILDMLSLAGIPLLSADRKDLRPIVFAGGACMYNPEPIADFIDLAVIGEGEELDAELTELFRTAKREGWTKERFLRAAAGIEGVYVPSLYDVRYGADGTLASVTPRDGAPERVRKRILQDLDGALFPVRTVIPSTEIVHDRTMLELFRGCIRGCRFCQAGYVYRPVRAKKAETLIRQGIESLRHSGYEEISLTSLSTSDYRELGALCDGLLEWCEPRSVSLSLPSLRADNFSLALM